jgi:uncharacterized protein YjaZ
MIKELVLMRNILTCLLLFILFQTSGCQSKVVEFERTKVTINNQKFEIITTYSLFDDYMSQQNNSDIKSASDNLIYDPLRKEIIGGAEAAFMFETIRIPYQPGGLLKKEVELLRNSDILDITKTALLNITSNLPGPDTKIIFMPANPAMHDLFVKYNFCMNGVTLGSGKIIIMIDPSFPQWKKTLPNVLAHEYHHSTWISRNWKDPDFTLLEYLIFEGRADAFASNLYKDAENPWTAMIDKEQEDKVWKLIRPEIFMKGHERINKVMSGNSDIPVGSGYTIGFHIVKSFKQNNPEYSDREIIDLKPEVILKKSKYE